MDVPVPTLEDNTQTTLTGVPPAIPPEPNPAPVTPSDLPEPIPPRSDAPDSPAPPRSPTLPPPSEVPPPGADAETPECRAEVVPAVPPLSLPVAGASLSSEERNVVVVPSQPMSTPPPFEVPPPSPATPSGRYGPTQSETLGATSSSSPSSSQPSQASQQAWRRLSGCGEERVVATPSRQQLLAVNLASGCHYAESQSVPGLIATSRRLACYVVKEVSVKVSLVADKSCRIVLKGPLGGVAQLRLSDLVLPSSSSASFGLQQQLAAENLCSIDTSGNMYLWALSAAQGKLDMKPVLRVTNDPVKSGWKFSQIAWNTGQPKVAHVFAVALTNGTLQVWDSQEISRLFAKTPGGPASLDVTDGIPIQALSERAVRVLSIEGVEFPKITALSFGGNNGSLLAVAESSSGSVSVWDWTSVQCLRKWCCHASALDVLPITFVCFAEPASAAESRTQLPPVVAVCGPNIEMWDPNKLSDGGGSATLLHRVSLPESVGPLQACTDAERNHLVAIDPVRRMGLCVRMTRTGFESYVDFAFAKRIVSFSMTESTGALNLSCVEPEEVNSYTLPLPSAREQPTETLPPAAAPRSQSPKSPATPLSLLLPSLQQSVDRQPQQPQTVPLLAALPPFPPLFPPAAANPILPVFPPFAGSTSPRVSVSPGITAAAATVTAAPPGDRNLLSLLLPGLSATPASSMPAASVPASVADSVASTPAVAQFPLPVKSGLATEVASSGVSAATTPEESETEEEEAEPEEEDEEEEKQEVDEGPVPEKVPPPQLAAVVQPLLSAGAKETSQQRPAASPATAGTKLQHACSLCDLSFGGSAALQTHLNGKRHAKKVDQANNGNPASRISQSQAPPSAKSFADVVAAPAKPATASVSAPAHTEKSAATFQLATRAPGKVNVTTEDVLRGLAEVGVTLEDIKALRPEKIGEGRSWTLQISSHEVAGYILTLGSPITVNGLPFSPVLAAAPPSTLLSPSAFTPAQTSVSSAETKLPQQHAQPSSPMPPPPNFVQTLAQPSLQTQAQAQQRHKHAAAKQEAKASAEKASQAQPQPQQQPQVHSPLRAPSLSAPAPPAKKTPEQVPEAASIPSPSSGRLEEKMLAEIRRIESALTAKFEGSLQQIAAQSKERESKAQAAQAHAEQQLKAVQQSLKDLQKDMHTAVVPAVVKAVEERLARTAAAALEKVAAETAIPRMEAAARDAVSALMGKQMATASALVNDSLDRAVTVSAQAAFKSCFQEIVVPQFEKATQVMFRQVSQSFDKGLHDALQVYQDALRQLGERQAAAGPHVSGAEVMDQVKSGVQALVELSHNVTSSLIETQRRVIQCSQPMPMPMPMPMMQYQQLPPQQMVQYQQQAAAPPPPPAPPVHGIIPPSTPMAQQLQQLMSSTPQAQLQAPPQPSQPPSFVAMTPRSAIAAVRTPTAPNGSGPLPEIYNQVWSFVMANDIEGAFNTALSEANLDLVVWLCRQLGDPSRLSAAGQVNQFVLLSLVQQLGFDLSAESLLKASWLKEILLSLNPRDPATSKHVPVILSKLLQNINEHFDKISGAGNPLASPFKTLLHIVNSVLLTCRNDK